MISTNSYLQVGRTESWASLESGPFTDKVPPTSAGVEPILTGDKETTEQALKRQHSSSEDSVANTGKKNKNKRNRQNKKTPPPATKAGPGEVTVPVATDAQVNKVRQDLAGGKTTNDKPVETRTLTPFDMFSQQLKDTI